MKKILFLHTRELCYFSGSFFLQKMQQTMERLGVEAEYVSLETQQELDAFEERIKENWRGIVDINSRLPYYILEDGTPLVDAMGAPFYNYILDHPLYHHPGLVFPLKDYHVLGIDKKHCAYMKTFYPHLKETSFLPVGATRWRRRIPFSQRKIPLLFSGTYEREDEILDQFRALCGTFSEGRENGVLWQLGQKLISLMLAGDAQGGCLPMEEALSMLVSPQELEEEKYGIREFPVLMNYLYLADKYVRNVRRREVLEYVADCVPSLVVAGEGWEYTRLADASGVTLCGARTMADSFALMADSRMVLDVNPLFACGIHDRVTSAMINETVVFSDMSPEADTGMQDGRELYYYSAKALPDLKECLLSVTAEKAGEMSEAAGAYADRNFSWEAQCKKLLALMK